VCVSTRTCGLQCYLDVTTTPMHIHPCLLSAPRTSPNARPPTPPLPHLLPMQSRVASLSYTVSRENIAQRERAERGQAEAKAALAALREEAAELEGWGAGVQRENAELKVCRVISRLFGGGHLQKGRGRGMVTPFSHVRCNMHHSFARLPFRHPPTLHRTGAHGPARAHGGKVVGGECVPT
jgi:hypothetical protein